MTERCFFLSISSPHDFEIFCTTHKEMRYNNNQERAKGSGNMSKLEEARLTINEVDEAMAQLFEKRMQAVEEVIKYKQKNHLPVLDEKREAFVIEHNTSYIRDPKYKASYHEFMKQLMGVSRAYQKSVLYHDVIGFQGVEGAFSHIAANRIFPNRKQKRYATFEEVFKAVVNQEIAYGIVPFENSYTGEVGEVLDLLIQYPVYVQGDYDLRISQNLLGIKGASLEDIKQVYSKDQAIHQSKRFLQGRGYELIPYPNTALAAEYVARMQDKSKAAIAAKENAELYGLDILAENINTSDQNTTRFLILGKALRTKGNRSSLAIIVPHKAGALVAAMNLIAKYGFNMQSIISRSIKERPWEYYFYIEIDGNIHEAQEKKLLAELNEVCEQVKILGLYETKGRDSHELCKTKGR